MRGSRDICYRYYTRFSHRARDDVFWKGRMPQGVMPGDPVSAYRCGTPVGAHWLAADVADGGFGLWDASLQLQALMAQWTHRLVKPAGPNDSGAAQSYTGLTSRWASPMPPTYSWWLISQSSVHRWQRRQKGGMCPNNGGHPSVRMHSCFATR